MKWMRYLKGYREVYTCFSFDTAAKIQSIMEAHQIPCETDCFDTGNRSGRRSKGLGRSFGEQEAFRMQYLIYVPKSQIEYAKHVLQNSLQK